jgi:hypothetical protein
MDHDTIALTKLKEQMQLRQQHHAVGRPRNESMTPQIKMIVSNWYTDELGNQARHHGVRLDDERAVQTPPLLPVHKRAHPDIVPRVLTSGDKSDCAVTGFADREPDCLYNRSKSTPKNSCAWRRYHLKTIRISSATWARTTRSRKGAFVLKPYRARKLLEAVRHFQ